MGWRWLPSRIARFVMLAFVLQLLVFGGVLALVWQASGAAIAVAERDTIEELRRDLMSAYYDGGDPALLRLIRARVGAAGPDRVVMLLARPDGGVVAGNLVAWPAAAQPGPAWRRLTVRYPGRMDAVPMAMIAWTLPDGRRMLVARSVAASDQLETMTEQAMLTGLLVGLALMLITALVLGRLVSRQIERVVATARAVEAGALTSRVPVDGSRDAFDALGQSINAMLDRIQSLVSQLRLMTDGLAHDFRSPITRLRTVVEQASLETRDPAALAALERATQETDHLLAMLSTALLISRTEAGLGREQFETTDLGQLLADLVELYGPSAEDRGFALELAAPALVRLPVHRQLVAQAMGNLVDNALAYASGGSRIELGVRRVPGGALLWVADNGPGIAEGQRAAALRRFSRLDPARRPGGSGLGLSLVEAVARMHEGTVKLEDNAPGLRVVMELSG
ncbi:ATP-binding protein [Sphingomonas sp.]|uniref:sensor histidine kinase n=1 Tax=Sphingomonas sp. TaxID=28214 RepID=UPI001DDA73DE|nr:ATP-binding protein [Sphingomonas sp.]MBX9797190.1 HAMP domain-containing protein [Sphingomonas sp.]